MKARFATPPPPTRVAAVTAEARHWERGLFAVGSLAAVQDVNVMSEVPGQIAAIHFESGKQVTAGDPLVTLDASVDAAELRGLQAARRLAEIQFERAGKLQHDRALSRAQYDEADARRAEADALCEAIPGAVQVAGSEADEAKEEKILAFVDGEIPRFVSKGSIMGYGMNFQHMPELEWMIGYPLAIGLMICTGVLPVLYFKQKGWL
jgi:multidrug efflux pump subunit AcrA (membrane-fusion protein)